MTAPRTAGQHPLATAHGVQAARLLHDRGVRFEVVPGVPPSATLASFGSFKEDALNLTALGANNRQAVELMDHAGWR